jgi:hypothetical protein
MSYMDRVSGVVGYRRQQALQPHGRNVLDDMTLGSIIGSRYKTGRMMEILIMLRYVGCRIMYLMVAWEEP